MTMIPLERLRSNPFRDFELHPFDPEQIEKLKASIDADGFWMSVVARKARGDYELAFGHHRIEAARQLGWTAVPIEVRDLTDWQMARMLASENATQRGSTAAACLDAVAALSKVVAYRLLRWENQATIPTNVGNLVGISHAECRGRLLAGDGIGVDCILGAATKGSFTQRQVEAALGALKNSGHMTTIVADARALADVELRAEQEAAERALAEAQRKEAAARTKRDREAAAKATTAAKRKSVKTKKATADTEAAETATRSSQPIIYDAHCAQLFRLDSHAETFRKIVTGETFQAYLPVAAQFDFAKEVIRKAAEYSPRGHMMTAAEIRQQCWSMIETGIGRLKRDLRTAPERPYLLKIRDGLNFIRRAAADHQRGVALLLDAARKGEKMDAKQQALLERLIAEITDGMDALKPLRERPLKIVGGKEAP
jgi:ParB-like chromosome segregation protein Spo0J